MGHTPEQIIEAGSTHKRLAAFLDAAHSGTGDLTVSARAMGKGRPQELGVPLAVAQPVIEWAKGEAKKIEVEFGITPWAPPKAVHGKPEKKKE